MNRNNRPYLNPETVDVSSIDFEELIFVIREEVKSQNNNKLGGFGEIIALNRVLYGQPRMMRPVNNKVCEILVEINFLKKDWFGIADSNYIFGFHCAKIKPIFVEQPKLSFLQTVKKFLLKYV